MLAINIIIRIFMDQLVCSVSRVRRKDTIYHLNHQGACDGLCHQLSSIMSVFIAEGYMAASLFYRWGKSASQDKSEEMNKITKF